MNLFWKITVWINLVWLILGILFMLSNNTFGWLQFIYGSMALGTIIKCLELGKEVELNQARIKQLENN